MIGPTCPHCGFVSHLSIAIDRFRPEGPRGYVAGFSGAPLRATREEAQADMCDYRVLKQRRGILSGGA